MHKVTNYTDNNGDYFDELDLEPYMAVYNVPEGTKIKRAMLVGTFMFKSENTGGKEAVETLAKKG